MRALAIIVFAATICCSANHASADELIQLAQATPNVVTPTPGLSTPITSTVTNCMMNCNSQAANCRTACFIPQPPTPTTAVPSGTITLNPTANQACTATCGSTQLACQSNCALLSPSP
jgi:hypothetical protein